MGASKFASWPVVSGDTYRVTVLADGLVRYGWSSDGISTDAETLGLDVSIPAPTGSEGQAGLEIKVQFVQKDPQLAVVDIEPRFRQLILGYQIEFAT